MGVSKEHRRDQDFGGLSYIQDNGVITIAGCTRSLKQSKLTDKKTDWHKVLERGGAGRESADAVSRGKSIWEG